VADTDISANAGCDHGIAAQSILLGAVEKGLGGCKIGAFRKQGLQDALNIPDRYDILLVIALGVPQETVVVDTISPEGDIKYWRDTDDVHHVPKRALSDLLLDISPSR
jgi:nitroreductase